MENSAVAWADRELIDTQWDVNNKEFMAVLGDQSELIDTQWDVNFLMP